MPSVSNTSSIRLDLFPTLSDSQVLHSYDADDYGEGGTLTGPPMAPASVRNPAHPRTGAIVLFTPSAGHASCGSGCHSESTGGRSDQQIALTEGKRFGALTGS